jgi:hypothetical protein
VADVAVQRFTVQLVDPDETIEVDANRIDLRRWEATEQVAWFDAPASLTKLDKLAYHACLRTGAFVGSWQEFDARAAAVSSRPDPTQGPTGPTRNGAMPAISSDSPPDTGISRASSKPRARQ